MSTMNMKGLMTVLILCIVGLAVTPQIQSNTSHVTAIDQTDRPGQSAQENTTGIIWGDNLTRGAARTILLLFPMFWVILMIAMPIAYVGLWLKGTK